MGPETSPVYAPDLCTLRFCPPQTTAPPASFSAASGIRMKGGQTATSALDAALTPFLTPSRSAADSDREPFIFQLPATSGRRIAIGTSPLSFQIGGKTGAMLPATLAECNCFADKRLDVCHTAYADDVNPAGTSKETRLSQPHGQNMALAPTKTPRLLASIVLPASSLVLAENTLSSVYTPNCFQRISTPPIA